MRGEGSSQSSASALPGASATRCDERIAPGGEGTLDAAGRPSPSADGKRRRAIAWAVIAFSAVLIAVSAWFLLRPAQDGAPVEGSGVSQIVAAQAVSTGLDSAEGGDADDASVDASGAAAGASSLAEGAVSASGNSDNPSGVADGSSSAGSASFSGADGSAGGFSASGSSAVGEGASSAANSAPSSGSSGSSGSLGESSSSSSVGSSSGGSSSSSSSRAVIAVSVSVSSGEADGSVSASAHPSFERGATAYDALCATGLSINAQNTAFGIYVAAIGGLAEKDWGSASGWKYYVNGVDPSVSCGDYVLEDGDVVEWRYCINGVAKG